MAFKSDINFPLIFTVGITGCLAVAVVVILTQALYEWQAENERERKNQLPALVRDLTTLESVKNEQIENLQRTQWIEPGMSGAVIPIEQAMNMAVANPELLVTLPTTRPAD